MAAQLRCEISEAEHIIASLEQGMNAAAACSAAFHGDASPEAALLIVDSSDLCTAILDDCKLVVSALVSSVLEHGYSMPVVLGEDLKKLQSPHVKHTALLLNQILIRAFRRMMEHSSSGGISEADRHPVIFFVLLLDMALKGLS